METHLAENAFVNQLAKSFVPRKVCPSIFVTFVWDNNDVNPESIFGKTMHFTNGIIIQIPSGITQQSNRPCQSGRKTRNRSFSRKECKIARHINCTQQSPSSDYADVSLEISEVDSGLKILAKQTFYGFFSELLIRQYPIGQVSITSKINLMIAN